MTSTEQANPGRRAGDLYISTTAAAELVHVTPSGFRSLAARARAAGRPLEAPRDRWPDKRTPLWDRAAVAEYAASRPGRGGRPRTSPAVDEDQAPEVPGA